jgi:hypothetical protein
MFDRVGHSVIRLKRVRTGNQTLGDLQEGSFRYLTNDEVTGLKELALKPEVSRPKPAVRSQEPEARRQKAVVRPQRAVKTGRDEPRLMNARGTKKPAHRGAQADARPWRAELGKKEGPGSGVKGRGVVSGYGRPAIGARSQKAGVGRVRTPAMQDTREGLRRNQVVKASAPQQTRSFDGPRRVDARSKPRGDSTYRPTSRPAASRPAMRTGIGRPAPGAAMEKPDVRRKPDQRPWPGTRKSGPGSKAPGAVPGYGPRRDSSARPSTRATMGRPTMRTGIGRPAAGAVSGRPETRRKPAARSWPDSGSGRSDSGGKGAWHGGQRPVSGPRPNKSTHTGKGPRRANRPAGSRGPGQGAGKRGPRR